MPCKHPTGDLNSDPASLGLSSLLALVVANMIGIGVFTSSGFSLATLGSPGQVLLAWAICGIWAISGAIGYGGLASRLPVSGGEYLFLSRLVHPSIGFLAGWTSLLAGFTAPIALAAKGAAIHILAERTSEDILLSILAASLILIAAGCHLAGVQLGTQTQNGIVVAKILLLVGIIVFAWFSYSSGSWKGGSLPGRSAGWLPGDASQWWILAGSMSWIALSYTGFNAAVYVAGETKRAERNVPRAMLVGTLLVTLLYLALNIIFVYAPAPKDLVDSDGRGREAVAMIAAQSIGGSVLAGVLRMTIVLAMISSVFAMLMLGPRVYRQMSLDGVMPRMIGSSSFRPAILIQAVLSAITVFLGDLLQLMTYLGLTLSACSALTVGSLWWIHRHQPEGHPLTLVERLAVFVYFAISLCIIVAASQQRTDQFIAMLATFAIGLGLFAVWRFWQPTKAKPLT